MTAPVPMRIADVADRSLPRKINFTAHTLAAVHCPPGRRDVHVYDNRTPGLAYRVTENGATAYYFYRRINGRPKRMRIGGREMTIEQARRAVMQLNGRVASGADPAEERRQARLSGTLQQLWDAYLHEHLEPRASARTLATDKSRFTTCFAGWESRQVLSITPTDVRGLHAKLGAERGQVTANRAVQLLRRLYNFAKLGHNPVGRGEVNLFRERSRDRFLQPDELPKLFAALDDSGTSSLVRDFIYLCLFTGARRSNVAAMRDEEINVAAATWKIPAGKSKSGEAMTIPLAPPALAIIRRRMGHASGYVFPGPGASGHFIEPKWTWAQIVQRSGLKDLHIHDLRRSLGSWAAMTGASTLVIGKALGHRDPSSTAVYARLNIDPVRVAVDAATDAMQRAVDVAQRQERRSRSRKRQRAARTPSARNRDRAPGRPRQTAAGPL